MKQTNFKVENTIRHKISRKMTLQACLIALVAMLAISFSSVILEQFLVREALKREAIHFWKQYSQVKNFTTPNTDNLKGYLTSPDARFKLPENLVGYDLGYHKIHGQTEHSLLFVSEQGDKRLHLLFDGESVMRLAVFFGVLPLTIILILIYITAWWVYRETNILLSPIIWLADKLDQVDPATSESALIDTRDVPGDVDWEVDKLIKSYISYNNRIARFIERERSFTRDASHEFRTPLTVINLAADMLANEQGLDSYANGYVTKIKNSSQDMQSLLEAFLILARETDQEFKTESIDMLAMLEVEIKAASIYLVDKNISVRIEQRHPLILNTARQVLSIVLGNLIRNAIAYTQEGEVVVTIQSDSVSVADTGVGLSKGQMEKIFKPYYRASKNSSDVSRRGYGVGLAIVKRLSNRFNWALEVNSEVGVGTTIKVQFDNSEVA